MPTVGRELAALARAVAVAAYVVGLVGVLGDDVVRHPDSHQLAMVQPGRLVAEGPHLLDRMGDDDDGAALAAQVGELLCALLLEGHVAHGQHLVDEQDVGLDVDGD